MIPFEISLFFKPMLTTAMQLLTSCKACHDFELGVSFSAIDQFTAVGLVVTPVSESEAEADIFSFSWKLCWKIPVSIRTT